mmetsp:Transcript_49292/g.130616  ORF Transcript_49292/g.130616 Transcript_49292/m.130616 type:complete len:268 (+) Transcript_49292:296-1099(+)
MTGKKSANKRTVLNHGTATEGVTHHIRQAKLVQSAQHRLVVLTMRCAEPSDLLPHPCCTLQRKDVVVAFHHGRREGFGTVLVVGFIHEAMVPKLMTLFKETHELLLVSLHKGSHDHEGRFRVVLTQDPRHVVEHRVLDAESARCVVDRQRHGVPNARRNCGIHVTQRISAPHAQQSTATDNLPDMTQGSANETRPVGRHKGSFTRLNRSKGARTPLQPPTVVLAEYRRHARSLAIQVSAATLHRHATGIEEHLGQPRPLVLLQRNSL